MSIGSDVTLSTAPFAGFTAAAGQSFVIIDNDASDPISGTFAGLPEGAPINDFLGSGLSAVISYQGGDGNDVVLTVAGLDYGDAPETYGTLLTNDGARHEPVGPRLGEGRDTELDGQPSNDSEGDDNLGDDEDGVMFGAIRVGDPMAGINIDLQNAATALVDAWVDFDGNGVFDTTDRILASAPVSSGLQTLNFNVPADAILGLTAARVRVSTAGGLTPLGLAEDGEVEDYQVAIIPAGPEVESVVINGGEAQRSIVTELTVTFDREVTAPAAAFAITEIGTSTTVSNLNVNTSTVAGKTVAVLTFDPGTAVLTRTNGIHSLVDGDFRLDITAAQVAEIGGGANMAADYVFGDTAVDNFFRKYGDENGNNLVELFDFAAFRGTFGLASTDANFNQAFDNDGNGQVDLFDFAAFRGNFGS